MTTSIPSVRSETPFSDGYRAPDSDGYLHRPPTAQEVIDNTRPAVGDGAFSAWQMRAWGTSLILIGGFGLDGKVHWHLLIPFEAKEDGKPRAMRIVEVFPPPSEDKTHVWSFRPLDAETFDPVTWASIATNAERGRALHQEAVEEAAALQLLRGAAKGASET